MRAWIAALGLAFVALAGCADDGAPRPAPDDTFDDFEDVEVGSDSGIIRGVVIDETITPVADARIKVLNTDLSTRSNENGAFVFSDLEPGSYFLRIGKPGYSTVQSSVDVQAGVEQPPVVKVQLVREPGTEPYHQAYVWAGFLGCSMRTPAVGLSCPGADVVWPEHDFLVDYTLDKVPEWVVTEMTWESTQALGGEMSFNIRKTNTNRDTVDVEGPSPLALTLDNATAKGEGFGIDMDMRIIIFTAHLKATEPPGGALWGVGLQVEQDFDVYTHVFYNYKPDEEWRFLTSTEVPPP